MPGAQLSRRHFSIRAKTSQRKIRKGSKKIAVTCWGDFISPRLIPIKITFFLIMGATQCVAPYATLLMKELGLTVEETALIFTIGPLIAIFAPFLAGIITDRVGNFRTFLVITVAISAILGLSVLVIPAARTFVGQNKTEIPFEMTCDDSFKMTYTINKQCTIPESTELIEFLQVSNCGYLCTPPAIVVDPNLRKLMLKLTSLQNNYNNTMVFTCELGSKPLNKQKCFVHNSNSSSITYNSEEFELKNIVMEYSKSTRESLKSGTQISVYLRNYDMNPDDVLNFNCNTGHRSGTVVLRQSRMTTEDSESESQLVNCHFHCTGTMPLNKTCNMSSLVIEHDVKLSVGLFIVSKLLAVFMTGLTYSMFEAGVVAMMKEFNYDYGMQRIYGSIGGMVFAPLSGFLIDYFGNGTYSDYYIASFLYLGVKLTCALILTKLNLDFKKPTKRICGNITDIFSSLESVLLMIIVCISGMCYGFIEHFLPWHIHNLGAENWMIGLMTTVASLASLPFLALSDPICRKFGHIQAICFALVCYSVRCFGYSMIKDPFWCFPFEVLEGITTGLLVAAAIIYGAHLSSLCNVGTLQGILATSHYGLGKSAGSLLGGYMMAKLSAVIAFRIFSAIAFVTAFSYYLFFKLILRPMKKKQRQEVMEMPVEVIPTSDLTAQFEDLERRYNEGNCDTPPTSTPQKY